MHIIFVPKPYQFVPRVKSKWRQRLLLKTPFLGRVLRKHEGVVDYEIRHIERLKASLEAGHGILLAPNHPRLADPMVLYHLARQLKQPFYTMASWHLFNQGWLLRLVIRWMGAFSVNREGLDRQAIDEAIDILQHAERPLIIFPEGATSRTNDKLMALLEGPAFIARTAAKRRAKKDGGKVIAHPIAIKYLYHGDIEKTCDAVLTDIEKQLTWRPQTDLHLVDRLRKVGDAMLKLKELEYQVAVPANASLRERQTSMVNQLLHPLEREWLDGPQDDKGIVIRIKNLRMQIFPEISRAQLSHAERRRRTLQLDDTYLAQQIDCFPDHYVAGFPTVDRILETVEKFEEDLRSKPRVHGKLTAIIEIGEAIEVATKRDRGASEDPLMAQIRESIQKMLDRLKTESKLYKPPA
jgi:1-acyl-sn-glycerol-3-phosphate acyltransferase